MNRYLEINEQYERIRQQMAELNEEYKDKKKGDAYMKRKMQLEEKGRSLIRKAEQIGTTGNICHIQGKRSRPHRKNPQILVQERFNLYFVKISESEASHLVHLHVKNVVQYTVRFIRAGVIITTS